MGKAKIISGGEDGRYQIQILTHKTAAEARIDKIEDEIEKLRSGEEVVFEPSLNSQAAMLISLIDDYRGDIQGNMDLETDERELDGRIAAEEEKLDNLEDDLSELEDIEEEYRTDYQEAIAAFSAHKISQEELDWYEARWLSADAEVTYQQARVNAQQGVVDGLKADKSAITYPNLDSNLQDIEKKAATFLKYAATEPVSQLEDHLDLAESVLSHMAQAFSASISWYNAAVQANYESDLEKLDLEEDLHQAKALVDDRYAEMNASKQAKASAQDDYEEQYIKWLRGEITEDELQPYADAYSLASAAYSADLAQYNVYYDDWFEIKLELTKCVTLKTDPMKDRMDDTATVYEAMSQDVASLRSFKDRQELKITSLEKQLEQLEAAIDRAERTQEAWCADLTEDLAADAEVGTIEIMGEPNAILVRPGYDDKAVYTQARDGMLQPPDLSTPAQAFYNYAMLPGWQKWQPTYRLGEITAIDGDTCTVQLDAAESNAQGLNVNQAELLTDVEIDYMNCNGAAFEVGDRVVVEFTNRDWKHPKVIGFEKEPQSCINPLIAFYGPDIGSVGWALYNPVADTFIAVNNYTKLLITELATAYVSGPDKEHPLVIWLGTYVGYITKSSSFSDNIWDAYDNGQMVAYTNPTGLSPTVQFETQDMHRVTMEHVTPQIWYSKIYRNPDWETAWIVEERWSINDETGEFTQESYSNTYYGDVSILNDPDPSNYQWHVYDWPYFYFDPEIGLFVVSKWTAKLSRGETEVDEMGYYHSESWQTDTYNIGCVGHEVMVDGGNVVATREWDTVHETWSYVSDSPYGERPWRPLYPVPAFYASEQASYRTEEDSANWQFDPEEQTTFSINEVGTVSLNRDQIVSYGVDHYVLYDATATYTQVRSGTEPGILELDYLVDQTPSVDIVNVNTPLRQLEKYSIAVAGGKRITAIATDLETKILIDGEDRTAHLQSLYNDFSGETFGLSQLVAICYCSPPEE